MADGPGRQWQRRRDPGYQSDRWRRRLHRTRLRAPESHPLRGREEQERKLHHTDAGVVVRGREPAVLPDGSSLQPCQYRVRTGLPDLGDDLGRDLQGPLEGAQEVVIYKDLSKVLKSQDRANALVDFLWWAIHDGQADAAPLNYGSIPSSLLAQDEAAVRST